MTEHELQKQLLQQKIALHRKLVTAEAQTLKAELRPATSLFGLGGGGAFDALDGALSLFNGRQNSKSSWLPWLSLIPALTFLLGNGKSDAEPSELAELAEGRESS